MAFISLSDDVTLFAINNAVYKMLILDLKKANKLSTP